MATKKLTFNNQAEVNQFLQQNPDFVGTIGGQTYGLQSPVAQPKPERNFLESIVGGIVDPFVGLGKKGLEAGKASIAGLSGTGPGLGDFISGTGGYKTTFMNEDEYQNFKNNPFLDTAKDVAGVAATALPGGILGKGALGLAKGAALSGALSSFANSDEQNKGEIDPTKIATDALLSGATGGGLGLTGKLLGKVGGKAASSAADDAGNIVSSKLNDFADGRDLNVFKRQVGVPAPAKLGGALLEKESLNLAKQFGKNITNADDLANFSDELFNQFGGQIAGAADDATKAGAKISIDSLTKPLETRLAEAVTPKAKQPIQGVLNQIKSSSTDGFITPSDLFKLKQEAGKFGKFNPITDASGVADVWQDAYGSISNELKSTLKQNGFNDYDKVNEMLEKAIKQRKWAETANLKIRPTATANDMAQDVAGFSTLASGNPVMAIPGFVAGKAIQSPLAEKALAGGARGAANIFDNFGAGAQAINNKIPNFLKNPELYSKLGAQAIGTGALSGGDQSTIKSEELPTDGQIMPNSSSPMADPAFAQRAIQLAAQQLMLPAKQGGSGMSPAEALKEAPAYLQAMYGVDLPSTGGSGAKIKKTESEKKFSAAGEQAVKALNILDSGKAATGFLASRVTNPLGQLFGTQSDAQTAYRSNLAAARGSAVSAISGANVPVSEYERIAAMIPEETDEPKIARQKLISFVDAMQTYANQ
jgi:hypothetical protein